MRDGLDLAHLIIIGYGGAIISYNDYWAVHFIIS